MCEAKADLGILAMQVDQTHNRARDACASRGFVYALSDESKGRR